VTLAAVGPLARTAEDLAYFAEATFNSCSDDISCVPGFTPPRQPNDMVREARVGWFDHAWDTPVTAETRTAIATTVAAMRERGFKMEQIEPTGLERAPSIWRLMFRKCLRTLIEGSVPKGYRLHPLSYEAMATDREAAETTYEDLLLGWVAQDQLRCRFQELMNRYTLLLCPVAAISAFRHGERRWMIEGEEVTYPDAFVYSQVVNVLGAPAATIPVATSHNGLPIGVQLVGRPYDDHTVTTAVKELAVALGQD
jgi:Asp-tRNA(Asn)/Glu-tRNA(Gln) amidotransferase A subunit family amidase